MLPENKLASESLKSGWLNPVRKSRFRDFEWGGGAIQDPTLGLTHTLWRSDYNPETGDIILAHDNEEQIVYNAPEVSELAFAFDLNMNIALAYVTKQGAFLHWYDTQQTQMTTTKLPALQNPRLTLDERRTPFSALADVLLTYTRGDQLYVRNQRERYTVEHALGTVEGSLWHVSMMSNWRVGFMFKK